MSARVTVEGLKNQKKDLELAHKNIIRQIDESEERTMKLERVRYKNERKIMNLNRNINSLNSRLAELFDKELGE